MKTKMIKIRFQRAKKKPTTCDSHLNSKSFQIKKMKYNSNHRLMCNIEPTIQHFHQEIS